jgi:hypothetical protein
LIENKKWVYPVKSGTYYMLYDCFFGPPTYLIISP